MKARLIGVLFAVAAMAVLGHAETTVRVPFDGRQFHGRIAWSADGNFNDEDDWAASPFALAILARCGLQDRLVHFDYNCLLYDNDPRWAQTHAESVLGAAERFGYRRKVFFDCQKDLEGALRSITEAVNASSAENPLWFVLAGPMEVPLRGLRRADPAKLRHVYCISHSSWNDGFSRDDGDRFRFNKRDVIALGVNWVQITDQNRFLSTSRYGAPAKPADWEPWLWLRGAPDPDLRWLWQRLQTVTRADCSDAGMAWFLVSGDERSEIRKVRALLEDRRRPRPILERDTIRLEAENFAQMDGFRLEFRHDRRASHRVNTVLRAGEHGRLSTAFDQPYVAARADYRVTLRYRFAGTDGARFSLRINDQPVAAALALAPTADAWADCKVGLATIASGDVITLECDAPPSAALRLDYVQLDRQPSQPPAGLAAAPPARPVIDAGALDDPAALPGQVIVAGNKPGYLKYNGGGPVFLCGPDNPEDFLFRGELQPDGARRGGGQEEMIRRLAESGVNAFHCQMFRMRRCNIKDEGDDTHAPFLEHDPAKGLNPRVLDQWDRWLTMFEEAGIIMHLEFYNDATDVERMGWVLDAQGNLHPDEARWIEGIVRRFMHHKNILWGIEESCNKLPPERTRHFKKIAELIARTDDHRHPIVQSFVVPNDPEGDFPEGGIGSEAFLGDPHIRVVTWLHVPPHGNDLEAQHREYLRYRLRDGDSFIVMKNETYHHPRSGARSRRYMWSAAMAGLHCLEAYHHADTSPMETLREDGLIRRFMERTDFPRLEPHDDLAAGSTRWVLARPGESYIAYTHDYTGPMGVENLPAGKWDLWWFDTVTGQSVHQRGVNTSGGDTVWPKPHGLGNELALYIRRAK